MAGFRIRDEMASIVEAPGKTWFWELEAGVIDAGRCVECGACIAACPSDSLAVGANGLPALVKMCTGCSLCWDFCPRGGLRYEATWPLPEEDEEGVVLPVPRGARRGPRSDGDAGSARAPRSPSSAPEGGDESWRITGGPRGEGLGRVLEGYTAATREPLAGVQDGGLVSALLVETLEAGEIDAVLSARESSTEPWKGVAHLAKTSKEVLAGAGSFYNQTMALANLDLSKADLGPNPRVALVGTPCEVQGIKALQRRSWWRGKSAVDSVVLTVALLCTKSFDYEGLMLRELRDKRGVDLRKVGKVDVIHGKMMVLDQSGETIVDEPVKDFHGAALKGCDECADFLGRSADLSVGSVGSPDGHSTVLVRSEIGRKVMALASHRLELAPIDRPEALLKLDSLDKKVAARTLRRPLDADGPLFIDFAEHVQNYTGTDRGPVYRDR
jgi:coenzyme F420 hydrogenase subunit beta